MLRHQQHVEGGAVADQELALAVDERARAAPRASPSRERLFSASSRKWRARTTCRFQNCTTSARDQQHGERLQHARAATAPAAGPRRSSSASLRIASRARPRQPAVDEREQQPARERAERRARGERERRQEQRLEREHRGQPLHAAARPPRAASSTTSARGGGGRDQEAAGRRVRPRSRRAAWRAPRSRARARRTSRPAPSRPPPRPACRASRRTRARSRRRPAGTDRGSARATRPGARAPSPPAPHRRAQAAVHSARLTRPSSASRARPRWLAHHQHLLEPLEARRRLDADVAEQARHLPHEAHAANHQPLGVDAVEPGGQHDVADRHVRRARKRT